MKWAGLEILRKNIQPRLVAGRAGPLRPRPQGAVRPERVGVSQQGPAEPSSTQIHYQSTPSRNITELVLTEDLVHVLVVQVAPAGVTQKLGSALWTEELCRRRLHDLGRG